MESILNSVSASMVTEVFLAILSVVFILAFISMIFGVMKKFVAYAPNLLTSIGILGTFIGIVIGLLDFDPQKIDGSITLLLEGLKTAFITSMSGMGLSILFKMLSTTPLARTNKNQTNGRDIGPAMLKAIQEQGIHLEGIKKAVAGEEESSLAGQMKLLRSDINDNQKVQSKALASTLVVLDQINKNVNSQSDAFDKFSVELWRRLENFAKMMSKSATEQVINALKEVIADFNKHITEQFGDNFKALDASVQKLVTWQENYRIQLSQMSEQYEQGVTAITQTEASVTQISEESKQIPTTMAALKEVMEINQHQIQELDRHLEAFKDVRDKAVEAVPEIRSQIDVTVNEVKNAAIAATDHHKELLESSDAYIKEHNKVSRDLLERYVESTEKGMGLVKSSLVEGAQTMTDGITESVDKVRNSFTTSAEEFDHKVQRLSENLTSTSDILAEKSEIISNQLVDTVRDINDQSRTMVDNLASGNKELSTIMGDTGKQVMQSSEAIQEQVGSSIKQMQAQLESSLEEVFQVQTREINRAFDGVNETINSAVTRTGEGVNTQLKMIDESMEKEIERVMTSMGQALASIANQFTGDYSNLVSEMQNVVNENRRAT